MAYPKPTPKPGADGAYMPGGEVYETDLYMYKRSKAEEAKLAAKRAGEKGNKAKTAKDAVERVAATRAKKAAEKAATSYKLPGGRTKYDSYGVKNGFKSAD